MGSTAVMNVMLGWLKRLASWVLGLFHLAGSSGFSPLKWLSEHWLGMLIVLLVAGVVIDFLVWILRWRPYWIWFNKKRIVIDDDKFFAGEDLVDSGLYDPTLFTGGERPANRRRARPVEDDPFYARPEQPRRTTRNASSPVPGARRRSAVPPRRPQPASEADALFEVKNGAHVYPDKREDEVFNVSDLPVSRDELAFRHSQQRRQ